jgi:hypothetical protein
MTAVRSILTRAVRLLGAVSQGTPLAAGDAADALVALNSMLAAWNISNLNVFTRNIDTYTLVAGKQIYTLGPSGDIAVAPQTRPNGVDRALLRVTTVIPNLELPIEILQDDEWAAIPIKDVSSAIPTRLFMTGDFPNSAIYLWPKPSVANQLVLWTWDQLDAVADVNTDLSLPPGYERAIIYNLALELSAEYGVVPSPVVAQIAVDSLAQIKRINSSAMTLKCDEALVAHSRVFNWLTGE